MCDLEHSSKQADMLHAHLQEHIKLGEAVSSLRNEGVLIVGSGLSYHNMQGFAMRGRAGTPDAAVASQVTCADGTL